MSVKRLLAILGGVIVLSIMEAPLTSGSGDQLPTSAASPVSAVPPGNQLQRNPQLPQHPLGAYTDAQYEAAVAALRSNVAKQYADVLQKLGYQDEQGNFIQGSVETDAQRQKSLLNRSLGLAAEDVTHQHQQNGTLFSGLRGTDQARAEFPYTDQLGQLAVNTPLTLSQLYEQASGLMSDYTIQDNQLLADAAARATGRIQAQPTGGGAGAGSGVAANVATAPFTYSSGAPATINRPGDAPFSFPVYSDSGPTGAPSAAAPGAVAPLPVNNAAPAPDSNVSPGVLSATQKKLLQWGG